MRVYTVLVAALLVVSLAAPAHAYLGYNYLEINGIPVFENTRDTPTFEGASELDGYAVGTVLSVAVHRYFHLWGVYNYEDQEDDNFLGLNDLGISNKLTSQRDLAAFAPHFNYGIFERGDIKVDVFLGLGFQYASSDLTLNVDGDKETFSDSEFGVLVRAGTRAMVWRGLELYGSFTGSNIAIIDNQIFFDLGARYHFLRDMFDVGVGAGVGTDDFVGLVLSGRFYYDKIWQQIVD